MLSAVQVRASEQTPLLSCLLEGPLGAGKTALAATLGLDSGFPFVKVISSDNMVGYSEAGKCQAIAKVFDDAYRVSAVLHAAHVHSCNIATLLLPRISVSTPCWSLDSSCSL